MIGKRRSLWSFFLRHLARSQGFLDPITVFSNLQRFSKPSEVWVPTELLRSGAVMHARGLINSQAIQHNLDWVWPYWVTRQFDPIDASFIPRAFNVTHINLTHRNWTAVGVPDLAEFPIVDPRGLVTPHFDGWSIDAWVLKENKAHLIPSRLAKAHQKLLMENGLAVETSTDDQEMHLVFRAEAVLEDGLPLCKMLLTASADTKAWLAVSVRPYNPEGVSFIHSIRRLSGKEGWNINGKHEIVFDRSAARHIFSNYLSGDVFNQIFSAAKDREDTECEVGMATAAALYEIEAGTKRELNVRIPLSFSSKTHFAGISWEESLADHCRIEIPDKQFQRLYEAALRTLVLHSPGDVYPGPYTYKRFWFRDAAYILYAMLCAGMAGRVEKVLDRFPSRQTPFGYFLSQDGEWDSNGEALWILDHYCRWTDQKPRAAWIRAIRMGGQWIQKKRISREKNCLYSGLLPAGFSAEHLGPNDFYYWDDFWGVAGLQAAASLMGSLGEKELAEKFMENAQDFMRCIEESLEQVKQRLGNDALPASPYRRLDAGSIGSIVAGYPLQLWPASDKRLAATADFLIKKHFLNGGFYQEISHSGINAYLTLHVAQVLLRAGDKHFLDLVTAIASMATSTGQWPEAIHPQTKGGCMGDGQHVWAAAEWVIMMRHMFVREEESLRTLVLCSGIPDLWIKKGEKVFFGPAPTAFGEISITLTREENIRVSWEVSWHGDAPLIEVHLPGRTKIKVPKGKMSVEIRNGGVS